MKEEEEMSENKELYINFDEYIRQGEPAQRERAEAWRVAIGLQAVDGLVSNNTLKNRYMMVNPPEDWKMPESEQIQDKYRTSAGQAIYRQS